jgi:hypothetical protein
MTFAVAISTTSVVTEEASRRPSCETIVFSGWHDRCTKSPRRGADGSREFNQKDVAMQNTITKRSCRAAALIVGSALGLLAGCGFSLDPGHLDPSSIDDPGCLEGAQIELVRYSTRCEQRSAKSVRAEVGDGMEFSPEQVRSLESPCAEGPNPGIEIHLDHGLGSLIFDFSNVTQADRFPNADFEGYMIDIVLRDHNALLVGARVDTEQTNVEVENIDISFDPTRIDVNFEGVSYDDRGFVKIDLYFAGAGPRPDAGK